MRSSSKRRRRTPCKFGDEAHSGLGVIAPDSMKDAAIKKLRSMVKAQPADTQQHATADGVLFASAVRNAA